MAGWHFLPERRTERTRQARKRAEMSTTVYRMETPVDMTDLPELICRFSMAEVGVGVRGRVA